MKIIHRYILGIFLKNFGLSLAVLTLLFLIFDILERIDNIVPRGTPFLIVVEYFSLKVPLILSLMLPVAMLVAIIFSIGMLSKNSEATALRASGLTVLWITKPLYLAGLVLSLLSIGLNELVVPYSTRRVREIYNIDIQRKHEKGTYSQNDFWWRSGNTFYSVGLFDSRDNSMHQLSQLEMNKEFAVERRIDATTATWLNDLLGWNMQNIVEYSLDREHVRDVREIKTLPLPITTNPREFYDVKADPFSMSYHQLKKFIKNQVRNGVNVASYLPDLYQKLSFPFVILLLIPAVVPFALKPARSGSLASSFIAAIVIAFLYYTVHSLSVSFGRAELWNPLFAAWLANFLLLSVGAVLSLGAESP